MASRKTRAYLKLLSDGGRPAHQVESELTMVWTELSFALQDLKIDKLATRCNSAGALWADMAKLDDQQLKKTTASLIRIEQLATRLLESVEQ